MYRYLLSNVQVDTDSKGTNYLLDTHTYVMQLCIFNHFTVVKYIHNLVCTYVKIRHTCVHDYVLELDYEI